MDFLLDNLSDIGVNPDGSTQPSDNVYDRKIVDFYESTINDLLNQARKNSKSLSGSSSKQDSLSDASPVEVSKSGGDGGSATTSSSSPSYPTGRRMSRDDRLALESAQYHNDKDAANQDILTKALVGAGALGIGALLGRKGLKRGYDLAKDYHLENEVAVDASMERERLKRRPSVLDPRFWAAAVDDPTAKAAQTTRLQEIYSNPLKTVGAAAYRLGMDVVNDGTRSYYWRYNHPLAMLSDGVDKLVDPAGALSAADKRAIAFAVSVPAIAAAGAYDPSNPAELFRPPGMKQNNPDSDNPRQSTEPATELFQRFFMGRTGRPLAYGEAKKDIPDLTPERYKNYMRYSYQDKGPLGLGIVKATGENLEGVPEARVLGYPVTIPMVTIAGLGAAGAGLATQLSEKVYRKQAAEEVLKRMDVQEMADGSISYVRYQPETMTDPTSGVTMETGKRIPSDTWVGVKTREELPDPSARTTIDEYLGPKTQGLRRQQRLLALAGAGTGVIAGHFLGNFINNIVANKNNSPDKMPSTQEYGVS